ncbi:unnamed protein product [Psylliodes chrysocephalus]|uniref:Uncharacterized protein n=1 Tax=Psylliodes chrysocephalus TaxID=3402493 RepID=A0A9P0CXH9_9CUCU|nr:unnamed protein product [Psylliodes chrysocephala]
MKDANHSLRAGHGKRALDGIGGVIKRTADRLVALGEDIPDPKCLVEQVSNRCSGIQLQVVTEDSFQKIDSECSVSNDLKAFKIIMAIYQITWNANKSNTVLFRRLFAFYKITTT